MNIRVDLTTPIYDGTEVVFRSPVDCSQITGLIVYYWDNGSTASKEFAFADAHGNNVGDIDHLFAENVVVKVILDLKTNMAFVQNADTNAYLEGRFAELEEAIGAGGIPTDELVQAVIDELPVYDGSYTDDKENDGSYYTKEEAEERFCDEGEVKALIDAAMIFKTITEEEYEALKNAGELNETILYMIVESDSV